MSKHIVILCVTLGNLALLGCGNSAVPPAAEASPAAPRPEPASATIERPHAEMSRAVVTRPAPPAGPLSDERVLHWWREADLRIQLQLQRSQVHYHLARLRRLEESERDLLARLGQGPLYTGEMVRTELQELALFRRGIETDLARAEAQAGELNRALTRAQLENLFPARAEPRPTASARP